MLLTERLAFNILLSLSLIFFILPKLVFAQSNNSLTSLNSLNGTWQNELGSQLIIDSISTSGEIYGVYKSSSGVDGRIFSLYGNVNKHPESEVIAIAFTVKWEDYGSITSWTGFVDTDKDSTLYMKTLWHLVRPQNKEPWERIITNSSEFRLVDQ